MVVANYGDTSTYRLTENGESELVRDAECVGWKQGPIYRCFF